MLNTVYRLTAPRRFEAHFTDIDIQSEVVLVRPTHLSICNADQRYYQGRRAKEILAKKLPMAVIHEAIGVVEYDPQGEFSVGQRVVMIPNTPVEEDEVIAENYLRSSKFRASGFDGFMQEYVAMRRDRLVPLPDGINLNVAAFTELVSVSNHAINRFERFSHGRKNVIGIWGDGNLAFITSLLLKKRFPQSKILIFGKNDYKMSDFVFADETYDITDIPQSVFVDHAFECVGREASGVAINQIIDCIRPEGTISILGVSENPVPINTRMVLEKGICVFGSSRSGYEDFKGTIELFRDNEDIVEYLESLIGEIVPVKTVKDMNYAFDADIRKQGGKTIMVWEK